MRYSPAVGIAGEKTALLWTTISKRSSPTGSKVIGTIGEVAIQQQRSPVSRNVTLS